MPHNNDIPFVQRVIEHYIRDREATGVLPSLMISAAYKLATNPAYDLQDESRIYDAYLENYGIHTRYNFKSMFMDMMTGKDPTLIDLGIVGLEERVLNEDGGFISERIRRKIASEGRFSEHLGPRLVR
jgi:hypothetical protein